MAKEFMYNTLLYIYNDMYNDFFFLTTWVNMKNAMHNVNVALLIRLMCHSTSLQSYRRVKDSHMIL